jgi:bifunctional non-homologous end joining protein LigD
MSAVFVLGMTYLAFGERLGIKSPLPNARTIEAVSAK